MTAFFTNCETFFVLLEESAIGSRVGVQLVVIYKSRGTSDWCDTITLTAIDSQSAHTHNDSYSLKTGMKQLT